MPAAFWCKHPECTGKHGHSFPVNERCPVAVEDMREYSREYNIEDRSQRRHALSRGEYEALLAQGCSIEGCDREATVIDHDHAICPQGNHSCNKCRRGPLCHYHNAYIVAKIDDLIAGRFQAELDYVGVRITFERLNSTSTPEIAA
jgi:hypothetical protein